MHSWHIAKSRTDPCGRAKYSAIQRDRRWPSVLQRLQARGFGMPSNISLANFMMDETSDLNAPRFTAWMAVVSELYYGYVYDGQAAEVLRAFPQAQFDEYDAIASAPDLCVPNSNGIMFCDALPSAGGVEPGLTARERGADAGRTQSSALTTPPRWFNTQSPAMYLLRVIYM